MNDASEFYCHLDGQPDHLTPEHQLLKDWSEDMEGHSLFLNKNCQLTRDGALPPELASDTRLTRGFAPMKNMAWVRNFITGTMQPFWIGPQVQSGLMNEELEFLPISLRRSLAYAGILVPHDYETTQPQKITSHTADRFRQRGYAPIAGLIHPFHISALRRYYRYLVRSGIVPLGDSQSSRRYFAHNECVARFFHFQLTSAVSAIVGEPVKPSYVYFASYQEGASLEEHLDRSQCEFSITMCLDYSPEPRRQTPWPLRLHTPNGMTTVYQAIGDALIYRGCQLPHSRGILPQGHTSTSLFFHYVPQDFSGSLD